MEPYNIHSEYDREYLGRRKGRKLLAEKRRRARINQSLTDIKEMVCGIHKQNDPNYDKMEKAEILEATVDYLRNVRKVTTTHHQVRENVKARFQEGFSKCAEEFLNTIQSLPGLSNHAQYQLRKYLSKRVKDVQHVATTLPSQTVTPYPHPYLESTSRLQYQHPAAIAHAPLSVSPVKDDSLSDSGISVSPDQTKHVKEMDSSVSDSGLFVERSTRPTESRVRAWLDSTWSYSQQIKVEQQSPWRPW